MVHFIVNTTQQQIYILEKLVIENLNFQQRSSGKYKYIFHTLVLCNKVKPQALLQTHKKPLHANSGKATTQANKL